MSYDHEPQIDFASIRKGLLSPSIESQEDIELNRDIENFNKALRLSRGRNEKSSTEQDLAFKRSGKTLPEWKKQQLDDFYRKVDIAREQIDKETEGMNLREVIRYHTKKLNK